MQSGYRLRGLKRMDADESVGFIDSDLLAGAWLKTGGALYGSKLGSDLAGEGSVDFGDMREFSKNRLTGVE